MEVEEETENMGGGMGKGRGARERVGGQWKGKWAEERRGGSGKGTLNGEREFRGEGDEDIQREEEEMGKWKGDKKL